MAISILVKQLFSVKSRNRAHSFSSGAPMEIVVVDLLMDSTLVSASGICKVGNQ